MKNSLSVYLLIIALLAASVANAQRRPRTHRVADPAKVVVAKPGKKITQGKWQHLGTKSVDLKMDKDQMMVTAYEGSFSKIKLKVTKAPVHIKHITILYANGDTQQLDFNKDFSAGETSKIIDLKGNKRVIQKMTFQYKTIASGQGRSKVTVWGMH
jgi:hypothetical protein